MPVVVHGLRETSAAFARAEKESRTFFRAELRHVAEPIARDAETLALARIRRMPRSPRWAKMRVGITRTLIYVAPRQRGVKKRGDDARRRGAGHMKPPDFGTMLMGRAMEPALARHEADIVAHMELAMDHLADRFNR